jgi:hypothetical protein
MRISLLIFFTFTSLHIGMNALATVNEYQEQRADMICNANPEVCGGLK